MQKITLILGGARSGKSAFGERLALSKNGKPIYIFTAQSFDEEMDERIRIHRGRRGKEAWQDVEANINLASAVSKWSKKENVILVDCLSLWLYPWPCPPAAGPVPPRPLAHQGESVHRPGHPAVGGGG